MHMYIQYISVYVSSLISISDTETFHILKCQCGTIALCKGAHGDLATWHCKASPWRNLWPQQQPAAVCGTTHFPLNALRPTTYFPLHHTLIHHQKTPITKTQISPLFTTISSHYQLTTSSRPKHTFHPSSDTDSHSHHQLFNHQLPVPAPHPQRALPTPQKTSTT